MKTTWNKILEWHPCIEGWDKAIEYWGPTDRDAEITLKQLVESNGFYDVLWVLRVVKYDYPEKHLKILQDLVELYLKYYELSHGHHSYAEATMEVIREGAKLGEFKQALQRKTGHRNIINLSIHPLDKVGFDPDLGSILYDLSQTPWDIADLILSTAVEAERLNKLTEISSSLVDKVQEKWAVEMEEILNKHI